MLESKLLTIAVGLAITSLFLLLRWLNAKINKESKDLADSLKVLTDSLNEEKKQTVWRINEVYNRIDLHKTQSHESRKEVDNKVSTLMTEAQVKDFVDRSLKPIYRSLDSLNATSEKIIDSNTAILTNIQTLIERDTRGRKGD